MKFCDESILRQLMGTRHTIAFGNSARIVETQFLVGAAQAAMALRKSANRDLRCSDAGSHASSEGVFAMSTLDLEWLSVFDEIYQTARGSASRRPSRALRSTNCVCISVIVGSAAQPSA